MPDPVDLIIGPVLAEDLFAKTENPVDITVCVVANPKGQSEFWEFPTEVDNLGVRTSPQGHGEFWDVNVEVETPSWLRPIRLVDQGTANLNTINVPT